jgi:hypothetical protein
MRQIASMADEFFPALDGTALFTVGCSMNHSCRPNVTPIWCDRNDQPIEIHFIALESVKEGDELNFSYIDASVVDYVTRREMLEDYGFECKCKRCLREEGGSRSESDERRMNTNT